MKDGFVKVAAATPRVFVGNARKNADEIIRIIKKHNAEKSRTGENPNIGRFYFKKFYIFKNNYNTYSKCRKQGSA